MDVEFTKHAEDMLKERKFDRAFIVGVVANPERRERGVGDVWYAYRRVGDKVVRVVVKGEQKPGTIEFSSDRTGYPLL